MEKASGVDAMTPDQERVVRDLKTRIANMRHSNMGDAIITASLIGEGWPVAAVRLAMAVDKPMTPVSERGMHE
jgi:hypothetical protein